MKVYNIDKTKELTEYDLNLGYLKEDKTIKHYDEIPFQEEKSHNELVCVHSNGGKEYKQVIDSPRIDYQPARDEEVIDYVYIPYTKEELLNIKKDELRQQRTPLLQAFDTYKSNVFYGIEKDVNREIILKWYNAILNLDENAINNPPQEIKYYLGE